MNTCQKATALAFMTGVCANIACSAHEPGSETVGSVSQPIVNGVFGLFSQSEGRCLAVAGAAMNNGADIVTAICDSSSDNQRWRFTARPDGSYRIQNVNSKKCIRAYQESNIQQGRCIYKRSKWNVADANGAISLTSVRTGLCASAGASVTQATCADDQTQLFLKQCFPSTYGPFAFETDLEGWSFEGDLGASAAAHSTNANCNGSGCVQLVAEFTGADDESVSLVKYETTDPVCATNKTLSARLQRIGGAGGGGVQLFAQSEGGTRTGSWTNLSDLNAATTISMTLTVDGTFDPAEVIKIGVQLHSGTGSTPTPEPTTILIDDIMIQ